MRCNRRLSFSLIAALVLALLLPHRAAADAPAETAIEIPIFEGGLAKEFFFFCAREYEKVRPGVKVNLYGDPRIADKVRVRILEGSFPDITNAPIDYWGLIHNGDIAALNEALDGPNWEGDSTWRDSFLPGTFEEFTENGKSYGVPFSLLPNVIWYNPAIFEKHGWKEPKTWDEFFTLCDKIKAAGMEPLGFQGRYPYYAQPLFASVYYHTAGLEAYQNLRQLKPGAFDSPACVDALRLCRRFAMYLQPGAMGMSHTESQMQFLLGRVVMLPCGAWLKSEMMGKIPPGFRFASFNLPSLANGKGDPRAMNSYSDQWFVFSNGKSPKEAINFLRFMTSRKMTTEFTRQREIPSSVKGAGIGVMTSDLADIEKLVANAPLNYGNAGEFTFQRYPQMNLYWDDQFLAVLTGATSPEVAAKNLESAAAAVRAKIEDPTKITVRHRGKTSLLLGFIVLATLYVLVRFSWFSRRKSTTAIDEEASTGRLPLRYLMMFALPALLIYGVFVVFPGIRAFVWSSYQWNGLSGTESMLWVGLLHFKRLLLESDTFWIALENNLFVMLVVPAFVVPLSMFLAVCLSRGIWGANFFRIVFLFPNLLGGVAATLLWMHLYNPSGGLVNDLLVRLGFDSFKGYAWLSVDNLYWALVPILVWGMCGFNMILYLAAMQSVPEAYYEAAELEGASPFRQFWTITMPLIWDVLTISIIFMIIAGMKAFDIIWLLTNQRPSSATHVIGTRLVQTMLNEFNIGEAAALGVMLFLLVFIGSAMSLRVMKRETIER